MLLEIFIVFLCLGIVAVGLGYFTGDNFHAFVGLIIFFFLGFVLWNGAVAIPSGFNQTSTPCSFTEAYVYTNSSNTTVASIVTSYAANCSTVTTSSNLHRSVSDTYTKTIGLLLALAAGFGSFLLFSRKKLKDGDE